MQITIDTHKDSPEDIRKVIALLSAMTDKNYSRVGSSSNIFENTSPEVSSESSSSEDTSGSNAFASMFGSSDSSSSSSEGNNNDESSTEEEKADEDIELVPY
ncbi:hypothetical protein KY345_03005 [Candidatus Woesearchaeota archaeon]|nr:hypothetical protein [Candidatus Woesearchaeota archaeon]